MDIMQIHLTSGSVYEINVSATVKKKVLADVFAYLNGLMDPSVTLEERGQVFEPAVREMRDLLVTNVLSKFKASSQFQWAAGYLALAVEPM
jgi:hypothetical protein